MSDDLQTIDFRFKITRRWDQVEGRQTVDVSDLCELLLELQGVESVHSEYVSVEARPGEPTLQRSRLRVRTVNPSDYRAREIAETLKDGIYESPGVMKVSEGAWSRL